MHERAVWKNNFESKNVRRRESIFQAMRAAGIFGDVAADAAHRLRRRIGRVEVSVRRDGGGNIEIDYARLDDNARIRNVHFKDAIHSRQGDDDSVFDWESATAESSTRTARDERDFLSGQSFKITWTCAVFSGSRTPS